jgi:hypothetical protein
MSTKLKSFFLKGMFAAILLFNAHGTIAQDTAEATILQMLQQEQPYHTVNADLFERLGWDLPDGGATVKAMANAAPGGAFDPRELEQLPSAQVGYRAMWHEVRYPVYGLDWDITGLHLIPDDPLPDMPTLVIFHGGGQNWYNFFIDPQNGPGLGQYLAQKIPVLLVTIPGNYRHGGFTNNNDVVTRPAYLMDRDISAEEARIRASIYNNRLVTDGVKALVEEVTTGPIVMFGHSTGGEYQFILSGTDLNSRMQGLQLGWGTGGPAGMESMKDFREKDFGYPGIGPLTPDFFWDVDTLRPSSRVSTGPSRSPNFSKQAVQNYEHFSATNLRSYVEGQIREALTDNEFGVDPDEVIADLYLPTRAPLTGYRKMIWTVTAGDADHWVNTENVRVPDRKSGDDIAHARELAVANEFREKNPTIPIRVLLFDVPVSHNGHQEKPRQLAGGLLVALHWLVQPD